MRLDLERFFEACNPGTTIDMGKVEHQGYYIDFATVRGSKAIKTLKRTISRLLPHKSTCQLFTGHIGCGKSTELLCLKAELEAEGFHVVYFQATEDLDVADVDLTDILLAIAHQVSESLEKSKVELEPKGFQAFLKKTGEFLQTPIELSAETELAGVGIKGSTEKGVEFSLPVGIGKITAKAKNSPQTRSKLRQYLEPQTTQILKCINEEILKVATEQLKQRGQKGLVVIVDNLDRIENKKGSSSSKLLPEYLFVDRGEQLSQLHCHVVYTVPLSLFFSNEREALKNRLGHGESPMVLPMVPVQLRDGSECAEGMALLRQMALARAFPDAEPEERLGYVREVFDSLETLDRLCRVSGGHVRNLLGMLYGCLREEDPPISRSVLERAIRKERDGLLLAIDEQEWELLFQVVKDQLVKGDIEYQTLLRSLFVFEYLDEQGSWFCLNPLLFETERYKSWKQQNG
ncbi:MAG: ATP-binding protein [Symploca sp. SIO2E9]|nr:ATP-binding protein [Symploca sp. SIO2E9]